MSLRSTSVSVNFPKIFITTACFWLLGWFWKVHVFAVHFWGGLSAPLSHGLFPQLMLDSRVAIFFYALPLLIIPLLIRLTRKKALLAAAIMCVSSLICLSHIHFFNDATFTTSFWVSIWLLWMAFNSERDDREFPQEARWLAKAMIAVIFLGGFIGKLTPTYWSGEVLHDIYFQQKDYFIYSWLRDSFSEEGVRRLATGFSRMAIIGEGLLVLGVALRYRLYALLALAVIMGMVFISTPYLFSVMSSLLGMLLAMMIGVEEK